MHQPLDADDVQRDVGRRLAELRVAAGLTQEQFATRADIGVKYVQQLERGRNATLRSLVHLANVLRVSMADLMQAPKDRTKRTGRPPMVRAAPAVSAKKPARSTSKSKAKGKTKRP